MTQNLEIARPAPASPTQSPETAPIPTTASCCAAHPSAAAPGGVLQSWLGNRRVLMVSGLALGGAGLALGWDWLAAVGAAPLILAVAPCLVMCALGMCMMGKGNKAAAEQPAARAGEPPARAPSGSEP
jgi:hypothetical protein